MQFKIAVNETPENVVCLMENRYKILRLSAGEDGWFYYNMHMGFFPTDNNIILSHETELAENIKSFFDSRSF